MKKLILIRHAKSSWSHDVSDRDRPLTEKGIRKTEKISIASKKIFFNTEVFYSSPANRALHTALIIINQLNLSFSNLRVEKDLYTFESSKIIKFIRDIPNSFSKVICVGHNPAFTNLTNLLSDSNIEHLPTSSWAEITFSQSSWNNISKGVLKLGIPKIILKSDD
tara:strand:+ start:495 stop:989 length:495 start_codon:yes stop_codon:yes gene_type:complete